MSDQAVRQLGRCLNTAHSLETLMRQDSDEMDECTRGPVLTEYRDAMEQAISLLRKIQRQLQILRDEQRLVT